MAARSRTRSGPRWGRLRLPLSLSGAEAFGVLLAALLLAGLVLTVDVGGLLSGARDWLLETFGLGLAIVKHVLRRHQSVLHVDSELGKGSVFYCVFPPEQARAAPAVS